jgi:tetratricopeptide (TPR) repeat protein
VKRSLTTLGGLILFSLLSPAYAQGKDAVAAYVAGDYQRALADIANAPDADSRAFAARVVLAEAICSDGQPPAALLDTALDEADAALARQPRHIEGRLQRAIALSLMVRPMSAGEARRSGLGSEARDLAEAVLADDPGNLYAHGFLAVWNVEVVRRGGPIGAMIMGASLDKARDHYHAATQIAPEDAAIRWQWARALAALNAKKYRRDIDAALDAAIAAPVSSDLERVMQARAVKLKQVLETDGPRAAEGMAREML